MPKVSRLGWELAFHGARLNEMDFDVTNIPMYIFEMEQKILDR